MVVLVEVLGGVSPNVENQNVENALQYCGREVQVTDYEASSLGCSETIS